MHCFKDENLDKFLDKFLSDLDYLDGIEEKMYTNLTQEEKRKVDTIKNFTHEMLLNMAEMLKDEYYIKPRFRLIKPILNIVKSDFKEIYKSYYNMISSYVGRLEKLDYAINKLENINMNELSLIYELTLLTFLLISKDLSDYDYMMLNKNRYSDEDLFQNDLENIKDCTKYQELALTNLNRKLKKEC